MLRFDSSHPDGCSHADGASGWAIPPCEPREYLVAPSLTGPALHLDATGRTLTTLPELLSALTFLQYDLARRPTESGHPARWAGFLNYDLAHLFESLPHHASDDLPLPLFVFARCPSPPSPPPLSPNPQAAIHNPQSPPQPLSNFTRPAFEAAVTKAIDYIRAGDIFQVNLAQRLFVPLRRSPDDIYAHLLACSPAWFGAALELPAFLPGCPQPRWLLSNSPELFLRVEPDRTVTTRPIKGTRPRRPGMYDELLHSPKDQAELAMIVDLLRNDLGRVCAFGSVRVTRPRDIEIHPTVYHGVSTITGQLRPHVTFPDLLRATFPCGSITGAPKIRAMQIIDELEPCRRGAYCGAIGYLDARGTAQFSVAIRTMTLTPTHAYIPVGGGIVADSRPADEYEETLVKAQALLAAL